MGDGDWYCTGEGPMRGWFYFATYNGMNPTGTTFTPDTGILRFEGSVNQDTFSPSVYNPWKNFSSYTIQEGGVMNDYTLYHEPKEGTYEIGWKDRADYQYDPAATETAVYTIHTIPAVTVSSTSNLQTKFHFAYGGQGDLGDIFTGDPSNTATWDLSYSMAGKTSANLVEHGAGEILAGVRVMCPHDDSYLERDIAKAYMRLHLFVFASVKGPTQQGSLNYNATEIFPYAPTDSAKILGLTSLGFYTKSIIQRQDAIYTNKGTLSRYSGSAYEGGISFDSQAGTSSAGPTCYVLPGISNYGSNLNDARRELISSFNIVSDPYNFKSPSELNSILGAEGTYYVRPDPFTLYYDPTGSQKKYSRGNDDTRMLFVLHIAGGNSMVTGLRPVFFDPAFYPNP